MDQEKIALINALVEERALKIYYKGDAITHNAAISQAKTELRKAFATYPGVQF